MRHGSALCLCGLGGGALPDQLGRQVLPRDCRENAIRNAHGEHIRPLIHSLIGNADSLGGCCDGAAQKFNGFLLKHAALNHGSHEKATIVHANPGIIYNHG